MGCIAWLPHKLTARPSPAMASARGTLVPPRRGLQDIERLRPDVLSPITRPPDGKFVLRAGAYPMCQVVCDILESSCLFPGLFPIRKWMRRDPALYQSVYTTLSSEPRFVSKYTSYHASCIFVLMCVVPDKTWFHSS